MSSDKSLGQTLGGVVGAAVGFAVGGPQGALIGFNAGTSLGGLVDPPKGPRVSGPRLTDLTQQVASYGQPLPRIKSKFVTHGTVIWIQNNRLIEISETQTQGGKGAPEVTTETFHYFGTFAVVISATQLAGITKIWLGGELWYDAGSQDLATVVQSNANSELFTFYPGSDSQTVDPLIEADKGDAPAYRGVAYVVFDTLPLQKYGNSIIGTQAKFEVIAGSVSDQPLQISAWETVDEVSANNLSLSGSPEKTTLALGNDTWGNQNNDRMYDKYDLIPGKTAIPVSFEVAANPRQTIKSYADVNQIVYIGGPSVAWAWVGQDAYHIRLISSGSQIRYRSGSFYALRSGVIHKAAKRSYDGVGSPFDRSITASSADLGTTVSPNDTVRGFDIVGGFVYAYAESHIWKLDPDSLAIVATFTPSSGTYPMEPSAPEDTWIIEGDGYLWAYLPNQNSQNGELYRINSDFDGYDLMYNLPSHELRSGQFHRAFIKNNVFVRASRHVTETRPVVQHVSLDVQSDSGETLQSVVTDELTISNLIEPGDIDVTGLSGNVRGLRVPGKVATRNTISSLMAAHPFDLIPSGYKVKAVPRGQSSVKTIPKEDLLDAGQAALTRTKTEDVILPRSVSIKYHDPVRIGDVSEQRSPQMPGTDSVNEQSIEVPLSLSATEASGIAENLWSAAWSERYSNEFSLPPSYQDLEPGDVVTLQMDFADLVLRINSLQYRGDGSILVSAVDQQAAAWNPTAIGDSGDTPAETILLRGDSVAVFADIPMMKDIDDLPGVAVAMYGEQTGWDGGGLYKSLDDQVYNLAQFWTGSAPVGITTGDPLTANAGRTIEYSEQIRVAMQSGELSSITKSQLVNGSNLAAYGAHGRWEILAFQNATIQTDGSYIIDTFIRGMKGTEWATGLHEANDNLILLNSTNVIGILLSNAETNASRFYRAVTTGQSVGEVDSQSFTYTGVNLTPLPGVAANVIDQSNDWEIVWTPRTRYSSAWWNGGSSTVETPDNFEIDILDTTTSPETVVRTLITTAPNRNSDGQISVTYTAADQSTDFGSPPSSIDVKIYQLNATVGRGRALAARGSR